MKNTLIDFLDRENTNSIENKLLHNEVIKPEIIKPEKIKKKTAKRCVDFLEISYDNFLNGKIVLGTYKVLQLKDAIKKYKLPLTGSKTVLITRLTDYFHKIKNAILIQKTFRKHMVCLSFRIRGPAYKNKKVLINVIHEKKYVNKAPEYKRLKKNINEGAIISLNKGKISIM